MTTAVYNKPEQVLVIPRTKLEVWFDHDGLDYAIPEFHLLMQDALMMNRSDAERQPAFKQVIPYVIIAHNDDVLYYRRAGNETRLHDLYSIGFGGHINDADESPEQCAKREIHEELGVLLWDFTPVAVLNDDSTEVGRVHVGLVYVARTSVPSVNFHPSAEIVKPQYTNRDHMLWFLSEFEDWSQLCIRHLPKILAKARL